MDLSSLRTLAVDLASVAFGVPATVTRPAPDDEPITTTLIWVASVTEAAGIEIQRRETKRLAALPLADVATLPTGTRIAAPATLNGPMRYWRTDGEHERDDWRVRVWILPDEDP